MVDCYIHIIQFFWCLLKVISFLGFFVGVFVLFYFSICLKLFSGFIDSVKDSLWRRGMHYSPIFSLFR